MILFPLRREIALACRITRGVLQKSLLIAVATILVGSCAGTMQGIVRSEGTPLVFSYEQGMNSDTYSVEIDDEIFSGRAVMVDTGEAFATAFGTTFGATLG